MLSASTSLNKRFTFLNTRRHRFGCTQPEERLHLERWDWDEANISWLCAVYRHARHGGHERERLELLLGRPHRRDRAPGQHQPNALDVAARNPDLYLPPQHHHATHLRQPPPPLAPLLP